MKASNRNKVNILRSTIIEIISVLDDKVVINDTYTGTDIKSSIKVKKNAFLRAKYLLRKLQQAEGSDGRTKNIDWYKETINLLILAAEKAMSELARIMTKPVSRDEGGAAINSALDAKQEAYDYIEDIFAGVIELQDLLKVIDDLGEVKLLSDSDFQTGLAEEHSYNGFYQRTAHKIQPGYNERSDNIIISYDGTVGETVDCYGLKITLPKAPPKYKMPNGRKKKENQFWERPELPEGLYPGNAHVHHEYIEEEFRRRNEGYWFMNNGEAEYITGAHYMLLTHYKTDAENDGWFYFIKANRDLFYFLEAVWVDERALGTILGKTRRTGATYMAIAFSLTKGISIRDALFGLTSKKDPDARKVFEKITYMFKNIPFFFKPLNTGENLIRHLSFTTPTQRATRHNVKKDKAYDDLNTVMDYQATTEDSYDSLAVKFYIGDEFSKWAKYCILSHWGKVRKSLMKGGKVFGKAFILSTVEYFTGHDYRDEKAGSGDKFKHLFYQSDVTKRNALGRTDSGLYKIFISSLDNYEGFIDKYGNCISHTPRKPVEGIDGKLITMGVYEYLQTVWSAFKDDPDGLNDEKRKDPITEDDMFRIASKDSLFNTIKLQDQMEYNDSFYLAHDHWDYKVGNFRYTDGDNVEFYETPRGRFQISWFPDAAMANSKDIVQNKFAPRYSHLGCFGVDPYKVHRVKYGTGSKGSIVGYLGAHPVDDIPKETFFLVYIGRPQSLDIFFDDVIMAVLYYSMPALIESNIPEILKVMHDRGLTKYSMRRPDKIKLSMDEAMYGGIPSNDPNLIKNQASYLERFIEDHVGYASVDTYRGVNEIGNCPFNDLLADWAKFDILNREKYDATVASCLALFGAQRFLVRNERKSKRINVRDFYILNN